MNKFLQIRIAALFIVCVIFSFTARSQNGKNLALHQPSFASSARSALPDSAFDGDSSTRWESDYNDPQWIYVDLGASYPIRRIHILWDSTYAVNFDLQVSEDAVNWLTVQSVTGNPSQENDFANIHATGRYVRINATERGNSSSTDLYGYAVLEMEVYSDEQTPDVNIISPQNNTSHLYTDVPDLTVTAAAEAADGKEIQIVELYSNNTLIAIDTAAPFSFSLAGLDEGDHSLVAKAIDEDNAVSYSDPVFVQLRSVPEDPCSSPAWDNSTEYSSAGNLVMHEGRLYRNRWYTVGQNPLNNSGAFGVWELISTCSTPTTVNITQPLDGAVYHSLASIDFHVDALATAPYRITRVELYNGTTLIDTDTTGSFSFKLNNIPEGSYTYHAVAYDDAGFSISSVPKTVQVLAESGCNAPEWRPEIIYATAGEQVTYQGAVYKNNWYTQGQDPLTNSGQYQVWTLISTCGAMASITGPTDSTVYTAPANINITAEATDGGSGITRVEFWQGATLLASSDTPPYNFNWTGVSAGNYALSVKAYNGANVIATSPTVNITVNQPSTTYTWTGAGGNTDWNNPSNWTPGGIPRSADSVIIAGGPELPLLNNYVTISDLTILSDTLNLNGQQLMVTGTARFDGGAVTNGLLNVQCSEAWFNGTVFDTTVMVQTTCSNIYLNGSVFNGSSNITKQGAAATDNESSGGNTFNGPVTITNNTVYALRLGNTTGDDFNSAAVFTNNSTGLLDIGYNGNSSFAGDLTINSNNEIGFGAGTGTVIFDSSNTQVVSNTGFANLVINRLILNKPSGEIQLNGSLYINSGLNLLSGHISPVNSSRVVFNAGANVTGGGPGSFISGPVTRIGSGPFTFPIGKETYFKPVSIAPGGDGTEAFTAEYFRGAGPDVTALSPDIHHISTCEYWTVDRTNGADSTPLTLGWDNSSCGVTVPSELLVARWNGTLWVNEGNGGTTGNPAAGTITTAAAVTSFSPFTLASVSLNNPLPVEWLSFTVKRNNNAHLLEWSTATEFLNKGFKVERSADGTEFETIGTVEGAGNSSTVQNYAWTDNSPLPGMNFYRIKQTDADGAFSYSRIISIEYKVDKNMIRIMPNPAGSQTTLILNLSSAEDCTLILSDLSGRTVYNQHLGRVSARKVNISLASLVNGMYIVTVKSAGRILHQEKLIKR